MQAEQNKNKSDDESLWLSKLAMQIIYAVLCSHFKLENSTWRTMETKYKVSAIVSYR